MNSKNKSIAGLRSPLGKSSLANDASSFDFGDIGAGQSYGDSPQRQAAPYFSQPPGIILEGGAEMASASQLRSQLKREQEARRRQEDEMEILQQTLTLNALRSERSQPQLPGRVHSLSRDSDSGISPSVYSSQIRSPPTSNGLQLLDESSLTGVMPGGSSNANNSALWDTQAVTASRLQESEQRRLTLVDKLKEAQNTLQVQAQRLYESEAEVSESQFSLQTATAQQEILQRKLSVLERERNEFRSDKMDTIKKREQLQARLEDLEKELKSLRVAYSTLQSEHKKREVIVEQTQLALSMVEEENRNSLKTRETMIKEAVALKQSLQMAKSRSEKLEGERKEYERMQQGKEALMARNSDLSSQVSELKKSNSEMKSEVDLLRENCHMLKEEREEHQLTSAKMAEQMADLNSKCVSLAAAKDRLQQERLDVHQKLQQASQERDISLKAKRSAEQQCTEQQLQLSETKLALESRTEEIEKLNEELNAVKKVGEFLSNELSTVKQNLERTQEENNQLQSDKKLGHQQQGYMDQEIRRITNENQAANQSMEVLKSDHLKEKEKLNEQNKNLKDSIKEFRAEKAQLQTKCQELTAKLERCNEELQQGAVHQQEEIEGWKNTCERLSATVNRKESELIAVSSQLHDATEKNSQLRSEVMTSQVRGEELARLKEEVLHFEEENKRLTQEHAEDQQVIYLIEMQKNILAKNSPSSNARFTQDQLQAQIDHFKAELGLAHEKIAHLQDDLSQAKLNDMEGSMAGQGSQQPCANCTELENQVARLRDMNVVLTDRITKMESESRLSGSGAEGPCNKCQGRQDQIGKLRDINKLLNAKVEKLENENDELRFSAPSSGDTVLLVEYERIEKERDSSKADYDNLKREYEELEGRHRRYLTDHVTRTLDTSYSSPNHSPAHTRTLDTSYAHGSPTASPSSEAKGNVQGTGEQEGKQTGDPPLEQYRQKTTISENAKKRAEERIRKALKYKLNTTATSGNKHDSKK